MTFYNHIESVRCIAIDLTNGRKWRGASDKAVVFDALDAARREYMSLSDENAKLRNRITTQKQTIQAYRDEAREWREVADHAQAENVKLRELARELWDQAEQNLVCDENCPYGATCDWMESDVVCVFKRRMRELGVKVNE